MTDERQIEYDLLLHEAFRDAQRSVMRKVLSRVADEGLPGDHHFYISFHTQAEGVSIAPRLLQKYAKEMTIVLQHRFWDLTVLMDRFEVKLTFDGIREKLVIPFSSVRMFFDPSVPYGLQFDDGSGDNRTAEAAGLGARGSGRNGKPTQDRQRSGRKGKMEIVEDNLDDAVPEAAPQEGGKKSPAKAAAHGGNKSEDEAEKAVAAAPASGPISKQGPRLVETAPGSGAKVVSLDQFRKK